MPKVFITCGLSFGDESKGSIVDSVVRRYGAELVVRFNGGCQAGHNVYTSEGQHHTFSQIGSGGFVPKTYTFLSRYMQVNPLVLMLEAERLESKGVREVINRVFIDDRCLVTTPYHRAINRLREMGRRDKHGSCGAGIGACVAYALAYPDEAIYIGDLRNRRWFKHKLSWVRSRLLREVKEMPDQWAEDDREEVSRQMSTFAYDLNDLLERYTEFYEACGARCLGDYAASRLLSGAKVVVFEAAQGVLLDEKFGFHPHTTWSNTTVHNAKLLLEEAEITDKPYTIGIMRSFMTRHGAGPMPTESQEMTRLLADPCNPRNKWQDGLRSGPLDLPLIDYALRCNGPVDGLAVTHMDAVTPQWPVCFAYDKKILSGEWKSLEEQERRGQALAKVRPVFQKIADPSSFISLVEELVKVPVVITSNGKTSEDKQFHHALADVGKI